MYKNYVTPCKTHAAYICSGSARLKDLRQTCGMHVSEVRVFSRLRKTSVRSFCFREEFVVQICGQQCCRKCEQQNEKLRNAYPWVETEVSVVHLEQAARLPVEQVSWGNGLSCGRSCSAVQLRDEHV